MIRLAVLGDPVDHSLSPVLHNAALAALGIEGTYEARRVDRSGLLRMADEVRRGRLDGANITMPHKQMAAQLADDLDSVSAKTGSVNTWVRDEKRLVGYSTDGHGVRFAIRHARLPKEGPVLILGAGGAAAAAVHALNERPLLLSARRPDAAATLLERLDVVARVLPWGDAAVGALVINATPIGMQGEALPSSVIESAGGLLDMVYGATMTPAVDLAARRGIPVSDGVPMLVGQAVESFRLWTGRNAPAGVMLDAANASSSTAYRPKKQS